MQLRHHILATLSVVLSAFAVTPVAAQANAGYPSKPVTLVVPYAPGGGADAIARVVGQELTQAIGQPVIIQNKPGGATNIASALVAKAAPDGYTLMLVTIAFAANQGLFSKPGYDTKDFAPIAQLATIPGVLTVKDAEATRTFGDLVKLVRGSPGKIAFGTTGVGAGPSLACELMRSKGDLPFLNVPYQGSAKLMTDLLGAQVPVACDTVAVQLPFIKQGKVTALAVLGPSRTSLLPGVPSITELGFKDSAADGWAGIVAPSATPDAVVARLNRELNKIIQRPDIHKKLGELGFDPVTKTPQEFRAWIASEVDRWKQLAKLAGLKPE
ncbi:MAG: tripartite tricarboxylate transporter substrate binding protein [Burkholderiales bacterium]|nr:tripartite tricarboxylate transporter substrate binding protein [Burkholderiales bacterium]MBK8665728.1 tripartite tricarboxylate transporter substrate binding protein [Burkholderiales bacterium]